MILIACMATAIDLTYILYRIQLRLLSKGGTNLKDAVSTHTPKIWALHTISPPSLISLAWSQGTTKSGARYSTSLAISDMVRCCRRKGGRRETYVLARWVGICPELISQVMVITRCNERNIHHSTRREDFGGREGGGSIMTLYSGPISKEADGRMDGGATVVF